MAQKKDTALSIASRREMADLLAISKEQSARIRVENIIHTDITVELMEILELYAELLLARAGLLDVWDKERKDAGLSLGSQEGEGDSTGLEEAAASIIYAAPRLPRDVKELGMVRTLLIERFGRDFGVRANENRDNMVPERVVKKLRIDPPSAPLVQAYLEEIARAYGVDWPKHNYDLDRAQREIDDEDNDEGGMKESPILADDSATNPSTPSTKKKVDLGRPFEREQLNKATTPRDIEPGGAKSPVSVAPPAPRSDNPRPSVKLPGGIEAKAASNTTKAGGGINALGKPPTVDDLAKRFQALKR